jgi:hypothetical protein
MDLAWLTHNEAILYKLSHILPTVGEGELVGLIGVHPDSTLPALQDRRGETLLKS